MTKKILLGLLISAFLNINPSYSADFTKDDGLSDKSEKESPLQSQLKYIYTTVEDYKFKKEEEFKIRTIPMVKARYLTPGVRWHAGIDSELNNSLNFLYNHVDEYQSSMILRLVSTGLLDPSEIYLIPKHERLSCLNGQLISKKEEEKKKSEKLAADQRIREEKIKKIESEKQKKLTYAMAREEITEEMRSVGIVNFKELALTREIIEPLFGPYGMNAPVGSQKFLTTLIEKTTDKVGGRNFGERKTNFLRLLDLALEKENPLKILLTNDIRQYSPETNAYDFYKKIKE